uniref:Uncharacterized protein n=2 Tax=Populus trichocarpa TaxID=3694 RepID=A0A3N7FJ48_POPTR
MGYLAVLLGNGSLEVWDVPLPHAMKSVYSSSNGEGTDPRFVKLKPVFRCSTLKCGGIQRLLCGNSLQVVHLIQGLCFVSAQIQLLLEQSHGSHLKVIHSDLCGTFIQRQNSYIAWIGCQIQDDGTMRLLSLAKAAYDAAVNGQPSVGPKQLGMHVFNCSSFAIWSIQVSRLTGMVAYCSADGTVCRFQLTTKVVEKDPSKHRAPHFACGSLSEDESAIVVGTPLPDGPLPLKRLVNDVGNNPKSKQPLSVSNKAAKIPTSDDQPLALCYGDDPGMYDGSDETLTASKSKKKPKSKSGGKKQEGEDLALTCIEQDDKQKGRGKDGAGNVIESIPPKIVAMHRV